MCKSWYWLPGFIVLTDIVTKWLALKLLPLYSPVPIFPHFNLHLVYNHGAAFSMLGNQSGWQRWFLSAVAAIISIVIVYWMRKHNDMPTLHKVGLMLILGGALGNLIDRLRFGYVIDFLDFYWGIHHFPAFNIADSAITCGAILLLITIRKKS